MISAAILPCAVELFGILQLQVSSAEFNHGSIASCALFAHRNPELWCAALFKVGRVGRVTSYVVPRCTVTRHNSSLKTKVAWYNQRLRSSDGTQVGSPEGGWWAHGENVADGSFTPISVPATLAVYPEQKWYIICARVRRATGGSTPKASQHSRTMLLGCGPTQGIRAPLMYSIGYAARVFSVREVSS